MTVADFDYGWFIFSFFLPPLHFNSVFATHPWHRVASYLRLYILDPDCVWMFGLVQVSYRGTEVLSGQKRQTFREQGPAFLELIRQRTDQSMVFEAVLCFLRIK